MIHLTFESSINLRILQEQLDIQENRVQEGTRADLVTLVPLGILVDKAGLVLVEQLGQWVEWGQLAEMESQVDKD